MRTIAVINQKGGCGKTTTAINLSSCLARQGKNVLLVDMDPQSHASIGLNINVESLDRSTYNILLQDGTTFEDINILLSDRLFLAPSQTILSTVEQKLAVVDERENRLKTALGSLSGSYDYVVIDTPPNIGMLTINALRACQQAVVPVEPSFFSLHGLAKLMQTVDMLREQYQQEIMVKALITMYCSKTRFCREILENVRNFFNNNIYSTCIRSTVKVKEATSYGKSILDYDEKCGAAEDYLQFSQEVVSEDSCYLVGEACLDASICDRGRYTTFALQAPQANEVLLVGDFNNWSPEKALPLFKQKDGSWENSCYLTPGNHQYKFIVDGSWVNDPQNFNMVPNEFGGNNSFLQVE